MIYTTQKIQIVNDLLQTGRWLMGNCCGCYWIYDCGTPVLTEQDKEGERESSSCSHRWYLDVNLHAIGIIQVNYMGPYYLQTIASRAPATHTMQGQKHTALCPSKCQFSLIVTKLDRCPPLPFSLYFQLFNDKNRGTTQR